MRLDDYLQAECIMNEIDEIEKEIEKVKWMTSVMNLLQRYANKLLKNMEK